MSEKYCFKLRPSWNDGSFEGTAELLEQILTQAKDEFHVLHAQILKRISVSVLD